MIYSNEWFPNTSAETFVKEYDSKPTKESFYTPVEGLDSAFTKAQIKFDVVTNGILPDSLSSELQNILDFFNKHLPSSDVNSKNIQKEFNKISKKIKVIIDDQTYSTQNSLNG